MTTLGCSHPSSPNGGFVVLSSGPTAAQAKALAQLQHDTGRIWTLNIDPATGYPNFLSGHSDPVLRPGESPEQAAFRFLNQYKDIFGIQDAANEFNMSWHSTDSLGRTHVQLAQRLGQLPVIG